MIHMESSQTEEKLLLANSLREQEKFSDSIKLYFEALSEAVEVQDFSSQVHALDGISLIYKIKGRETRDQSYKDLSSAYAKVALQLIENYPEHIDVRTQSIALSTLADTILLDRKYSQALPYFEKALSITNASTPEKGRLRAHIGAIKYLTGQKATGIQEINDGLIDIRSGDLSQSSIRTWETGVINALAKIYSIDGDKVKALQFAEESLKISTEHNLPIRKKEAEDIVSKINSGNIDFQF